MFWTDNQNTDVDAIHRKPAVLIGCFEAICKQSITHTLEGGVSVFIGITNNPDRRNLVLCKLRTCLNLS